MADGIRLRAPPWASEAEDLPRSNLCSLFSRSWLMALSRPTTQLESWKTFPYICRYPNNNVFPLDLTRAPPQLKCFRPARSPPRAGPFSTKTLRDQSPVRKPTPFIIFPTRCAFDHLWTWVGAAHPFRSRFSLKPGRHPPKTGKI